MKTLIAALLMTLPALAGATSLSLPLPGSGAAAAAPFAPHMSADEAAFLDAGRRELLLADLPAGSPPPTTPPVLLQTIDNDIGYVPATWRQLTIGQFTIGISSDIGDFYTVGARDYYNGQWVAGWGKEISPIEYKGREVAYIALQNVFNADEGGKGAIGGALGIRPLNVINAAGEIAGAAGDLVTLPPWAQGINNYLSIEGGFDYRLQNTAGVSREVATVGGQVRLPFNLAQGE